MEAWNLVEQDSQLEDSLKNLELSKNDDKRDITLKNKKEKFKRDLVKGIIFSEILSGPRCLQNQRRSL